MIISAITPDQKTDYLAQLVLEGFRRRGDTIYVSDPGNGIDQRTSEQDFVSAARGSDLILVFSAKIKGNRAPKYHLLNDDQILNSPAKIAYIDGSEWTYTGCELPTQAADSLLDPEKRRGDPWINESMFSRVHKYFKRETYEQDYDRGIVPLLFGFSLDRHDLPEKQKDVDLFCSFGNTRTGLRKDLIDACSKLQKDFPSKNIVIGSGYDHSTFSDLMARSRIVVDAWGAGDCCDRFWEAMGARATCLYQRYNIEFPKKPSEWCHAVSFTDIGEFLEKAKFLMENPDLTKKIGLAGREHALEFHTSVHRAETIIKEVGLGDKL